MDQQSHHKLTPEQQRNMQLLEERYLLLDTIRDMIDDELDRRGMSDTINTKEPQDDPITQEEKKGGTGQTARRKSCCHMFRSLWKRIASHCSLLLLL